MGAATGHASDDLRRRFRYLGPATFPADLNNSIVDMPPLERARAALSVMALLARVPRVAGQCHGRDGQLRV